MKVLVTGAAGGLGREFLAECVRRGFDVCATDVDPRGLETIRQGLFDRFKTEIDVFPCDITREASVEELVSHLEIQGFRPDMLLNVAGVDFEGGFLSRDFSEIGKIVEVNVLGSLRMTHRILSLRDPKAPFYLVFVSSLAAGQPIPLKATYAASKRFLLDFSRALGEELREEGVSVLSVCPGGMATTPKVVEAILAQGFFGAVTTCPVERIVSRTIRLTLKGKAVYVPGLFNRFTLFLNRFLPVAFTLRILHGRWKRAQERWLSPEAGRNAVRPGSESKNPAKSEIARMDAV